MITVLLKPAKLFIVLYLILWPVFVNSNNMLYPKEDKENRILLYAVSHFFAVR